MKKSRLANLVLALALPGAIALTTPTATAATSAAAATGGTFSVLSYNIAGLPEGLSSAPTPRAASTTTIGQRLGPYDIVHAEEDFNYHAYLYAADAHPYRTATTGGAGLGSGLNTLSTRSWAAADFHRVKWDNCFIGSADCLTPKGFTFMRVRVAEGAYVDFYNLHTDAGTLSGDYKARAGNLTQLTAYIKSHSTGNAVIVMGDTNTRYSRTSDTIASFVSANGLTDAWVKLVRGGTPPTSSSPAPSCGTTGVTNACEVLDKILYRSGTSVTLNATAYNNDHAAFLDGAGLMLSDHDPISARFGWSLR